MKKIFTAIILFSLVLSADTFEIKFKKKKLLTAKDIVRARLVEGNSNWDVALVLNDKGLKKINRQLKKVRGQKISIYLNGKVIATPVVNDELKLTEIVFGIDLPKEQAKETADMIMAEAKKYEKK